LFKHFSGIEEGQFDIPALGIWATQGAAFHFNRVEIHLISNGGLEDSFYIQGIRS
jgi:hypothetical protein